MEPLQPFTNSMAKKNVDTKDDLAEVLAESINKKSDEGKVAFFLDAQEDPTQILDWISTGNDLLDLAISNRPNGGVPVGRITELTGLEASGKSLVCAHLLANTQKKGGISVFIDTEYAVSPEFLSAIGMDVSKMLYINLTMLRISSTRSRRSSNTSESPTRTDW